MPEKKHSQKFKEGLKIRRAVLGDEYVDKAMSKLDDLSAPLQELVTEYCWGTVWNRDTLSRSTKSLINIAMLSALNRPHEVELHLKGAINNGCTQEEILDVIMHVAVYCGVPAAIDTMKITRRVLEQ